MRRLIRRALTKTLTIKGSQNSTEQVEVEPSDKLVYGVTFAIAALIALTALQIVHIIVLKEPNSEMAEEGMTAQQIYDSKIFPNRSFRSIQVQLQRLGNLCTQSKKSLSTQIREAEIVDLETIVKRFVDAFNKICNLTETSKEDLERFRIIFSAARVYFDLYFRLEEF